MDEAVLPQIESLYRAQFRQFERVARAVTKERESALEATPSQSTARTVGSWPMLVPHRLVTRRTDHRLPDAMRDPPVTPSGRDVTPRVNACGAIGPLRPSRVVAGRDDGALPGRPSWRPIR